MDESDLKEKLISRIILTLVLASMLALESMNKLSSTVLANPIPIPSLVMPEEYIDVSIYSYDERLWARVAGEYPFYNFGHHTAVEMYYPVPPSATGISVMMDGTLLSWTYDPQVYPTATGDWLMISWMVSPFHGSILQ